MADPSERDDLVLTKRIALDVPNKYLGLMTLNREEELNPLDKWTAAALSKAIEPLAADPEVCTIAITGTGRGFCAGGDMRKYVSLFDDSPGFMIFLKSINGFFRKCQEAPKPVIGLINGVTVAGGIEMMLSFDFSYAAASAKIGDGHANFGLLGGGGANYKMPRRISPGLAFENLMTGGLWTAQEAADIGLINKVVPDAELLDAGIAFAQKMASKAPLAYRYCKEIFYETLNIREKDAEYLELAIAHHYHTTAEDAREGLRAFAEGKRRPNFKGR